MLLTITTTHRPATDLGYLLHKNPSRVQTFSLPFGEASVFYPEASDDRCTAALLMEIDPVGLVRKERGSGGEGQALEQYVNDRPYVASSFLCVAMSRVFSSAMSGISKERPELVDMPIPLIAKLAVVPCSGGADLLHRLFEPLGYVVESQGYPLEPTFQEWGEARYVTLTLTNTCRLQDLLSHLYVLVPVMDDKKHYWVGDDEVDKLLRHGEEWLSSHPERELIIHRYLKHKSQLTRDAFDRLLDDDQSDPDDEESVHALEEDVIERKMSLNEQRLGAVVAALRSSGAKRVLDLGCGEGKLIDALKKDPTFSEIVGIDVSYRVLEMANRRLKIDRMPSLQQNRIRLLHGSLMYRDRRMEGFDAASVVEVIEHLDRPRFAAFERVLFEFAKPRTVVLTTPNIEYNARFETLPSGNLRHKDHRFEWTRAEFQDWAQSICERFGYSVRFRPIGDDDPEVGSPTQMAIFDRVAAEQNVLAVEVRSKS